VRINTSIKAGTNRRRIIVSPAYFICSRLYMVAPDWWYRDMENCDRR